MCSRCFAGRYQTALLAVASTASPTGSPKSSVKPATSRHPENGQRLAANAEYPFLVCLSTILANHGASGLRGRLSMPIERREFLRLGLLAAASANLTPLETWSFTPQALQRAASPKKVLIVGAGLAGLVAGNELTQAGHDVTILEAQFRPGGRVQTLRVLFSADLYAVGGAARLPDHHDLTLHYVYLFGLTHVPCFLRALSMPFLFGLHEAK